MINAVQNLLGAGLLSRENAEVETRYIEHLSKFGISYGTPEEYSFRLDLFAARDTEINEINADQANTFTLAHNHFSTLTKDEQKQYMGKLPHRHGDYPTGDFREPNGATVDWRTKGAVNPVQNQGQCGSCWAFSSTAAMEGAHFIKTGTLLKLAESQFVDCDRQSSGCNGGLEMWAFDYAEQTPLELESDYPYVARTRSCEASQAAEARGVLVTNYSHVPKRSVSALKAAIEQGPTCVSVDAANSYFQGYSGGILNTTQCGTNLDHAVTAVGYGTESGQGYFIVRNSWGASWGESGYIRMSSDVTGSGVCGILLDSTAVHTQ